MLGVVVRVEDSVGVRVHRWAGVRGALGWCMVLVVDGGGCVVAGVAVAVTAVMVLAVLAVRLPGWQSR